MNPNPITDARDTSDTTVSRDERAALLALATLPSMYPRRLSSILRHHTALEALDRIRVGRGLHIDIALKPSALQVIQDELNRSDVDAVIAACDEAAITVCVRGDDLFPARLAYDQEGPDMIFVRGDIRLCQRRTVAIVGTRRATAAGRATAAELGRGLAEHGVGVVSGLASGIDAASHRAIVDISGAGPIAVVGSGLDVPYPRANESLWERVADTGVLISEWGPGVGPEAWHFPLRNRIIAALADVVVVVESRETGGSLITARAALDRGIDVLAVPGSVHCRAATGTNRLIADGAGVVCGVEDVLDALGLSPQFGHRTAVPDQRHDRAAPTHSGVPDPVRHGRAAMAVYEHCLDRPVTIDQLVELTEFSLIDIAATVVALEHDHLIVDSNGWLEAAGSRLHRAGSGSE